MQLIEEIKNKILSDTLINKDEAMQLAAMEDKNALYEAANEIRQHFCGNVMELCSITNAKSGNCPQDCSWCSQSIKHNTNIETYKIIDKNKALAQAIDNDSKGVNRMSLVASGRKANPTDLLRFVDIYKDIQNHTKLKLCASMGLLNEKQLQILKDNGVETYHCNLETSRKFFPSVCTTHTYDDKINTIKQAQSVGMKICSGGVIGMGEDMEDRIDMAFELQKLGVLSIPINMLYYVDGVALKKPEPLSETEVITTFALIRFINPKANIRFAAGRVLISHYQEKALKAGVNSAIVGDMLTTIGTSVDEDKIIFNKAGFELVSNEQLNS